MQANNLNDILEIKLLVCFFVEDTPILRSQFA